MVLMGVGLEARYKKMIRGLEQSWMEGWLFLVLPSWDSGAGSTAAADFALSANGPLHWIVSSTEAAPASLNWTVTAGVPGD